MSPLPDGPTRRTESVGKWFRGYPAGRQSARVGLRVTIVGLGLALSHAPTARAESATAPRGKAAVVTMKRFEFSPRALTIAPGGTVRWTNADVANHQISSGRVEGGGRRPDGRVSSPLLVRGDEFSAMFSTAGEYPYYCSVHPFMRGMIVVE